MTVEMYGIDSLNRRPAVVDVIQLISLLIFVQVVMYFWYENTVNPLYESLECTCLSRGETCFEAHRFSYDFWYKYWKTDVPAVFAAVDKLKEGAGSLIQTSGRAASNILARHL